MSAIFDDLIPALAAVPRQHRRDGPMYRVLAPVARSAVEQTFGPDAGGAAQFGPFGELDLPYTRMGTIDSMDLFGLDELILFAFYDANRARYRRVADLGANLGLHSFVLGRCGFEVRAFEPDPVHFELLQRNLEVNGCGSTTALQRAVSVTDGEATFIRVLGNTTGSHLAGAKRDPYGELEEFTVRTDPVRPILKWADLVKMDVEGHEAELIRSTTPDDWKGTDCVAEIGSPENAEAVFAHAGSIGLGLFSQRNGWDRVISLEEMPTSHRDGSLFLSMKDEMPWRRS